MVYNVSLLTASYRSNLLNTILLYRIYFRYLNCTTWIYNVDPGQTTLKEWSSQDLQCFANILCQIVAPC